MACVPSFVGLHPSSPAASKSKRANSRDNTLPEILLRRELWKLGLRYRKNVRTMLGQPDVVFPGPRLLAFCDGDFWHGRNWQSLSVKLERGSNAAYWLAKIAANVERDRRITRDLEVAGWRVMRLWESDIKRDPKRAAALVHDALVCQVMAEVDTDMDDR